MPPSTSRQVPPKQSIVTTPGSLLSNAAPVSSLREEHVKICFYGRNRSGKTTIACQFKKPLLIISAEPDACGGATSVTNIEGVHIQRISYKLLGQDKSGMWLDASDPRCVRKDHLKGSAKVLALINELEGKHPFATVVMDTATSLQDLILVELMGWEKVPEIQHIGMVGKETYQLRAEKWRELMRPLLSLQNCNVITLCQEKDHNPSTDDFGGKRKILHSMQSGSFMAPALGATNAQWLQDNCGYVIQVYEDEVMNKITVPEMNQDGTVTEVIQEVPSGKRQRHLRLLYHPNYAAGGRWQFDRGIPEFVTAPTPKALYEAMAAFIPSLAK